MTIEKPMLAATLEDLNTVKYPVLATPKLDGIRCLVVDGQAVSRTFKPIPNNYIRNTIEQVAVEGFDGEIIVKDKKFNEITSAVMSIGGSPVNFRYVVFDHCIDPLEGYKDRMKRLKELKVESSSIQKLLPVVINNIDELLAFEKKSLSEGFEGIMLRSIDSPYKFGRSTLRQSWLLKLKRFTDSEAIIIDLYEQMTNDNDAFVNELGHTKRSSHQDGKVSAGTLGGFNVKDIKSSVEFKIGSGFDDSMRTNIWRNKNSYIGKVIKYKSQKSGEKTKPRFPVFLGFRDQKDISLKDMMFDFVGIKETR